MQWKLLQSVTHLEPARSIRGTARTDYPSTLFADHFPSFPVTPGVLLLEICAQLGGLLVQATVLDTEDRWVFPVLAMVRHAKFIQFVGPEVEVEIEASLRDQPDTTATCRAQVSIDGQRCVAADVVYSINAEDMLKDADAAELKTCAVAEYRRLESPWLPSLPTEAG
ncbi:MAG: hypothetical protein AAGD38_05665 [Acidobacteriota bacterium]